jgi:hypothetical protein
VLIDNPVQVDRLLPMLRSSLPFAARMTPELAGTLREQLDGMDVPSACELTRVDYAGDEGGIMCRLVLGGETGERVFFVSITHLRFDGRSPLAREIAAYQKRRCKRLRRLGHAA